MIIVYFVDVITFFILISADYGSLNYFEELFFDFYGVYVVATIQDSK